ncbi:hypothetical protein OCU04_004096 [Sclerotinia nivalis]|uniref:Ferric oxidoreductase domain-containing protein n=1 Tax=Sclerotinia nivalis TaxID=352851 RepID=A0A9X0AT89_9HELO|nr:hypothetical protein OCU04_004096 [Sclerotinia nivalis]
MFLINLVLLLLFGRSNVFAKRIPISQQFRDFIHAWLGVVAIAECVILLVADLSALRFDMYRLKSISSIAGLVASISLAVLGVFSLPFIRRHVFELFLSTHLALTVVVILATILYLAPLDFSQPSNILLIVAGSLHIILIAIRIGIPLWNRDHIRVFEENELLKADNTLPELQRLHSGPFKSQPQIQYEKSLLTENYDNYILFASGIGIIAHLGYVEALIERLQKNRDESGIKKISLFWEINEFEPWKYGVVELGALLEKDDDRCKKLTSGPKYTENKHVFRYSMFNIHPLTNMINEDSIGGRQHWRKQPMNVADILQKELKIEKTLVSVCANLAITDTIRNAQGVKKQNFVLHTYGFYPEDVSRYELLTIP